ncbi:MAG: TonB family protein [Steroidobacteraceae bacterium]
MSAHIQQAAILSGRSMTLMAVIGLHALVITALVAIKVVPPLVDTGPQPFVTRLDPPDPLPPEPQPTLPKPQLLLPTIPLLPPPNLIQIVTTETIQIPESTAIPGAVDVGAAFDPVATAPAQHVSTQLQYRAVRPSDDYYPAASVMLEEQGVTIVRVCVDARGRMEGVPGIQSSSGHKRLDQAAVLWARESLSFVPATTDGVAVQACKGFRVVFGLR